MDVGILGTGVVGQEIGAALIGLGHRVRLGSRTADSADGAKFVAAHGTGASQGTFADAAAFGALVFNCTPGQHAHAALSAAGDLSGKVIVDVSNPLDFSKGFPPRLTVCNDDSLAEGLQRAFPTARFVKSLNTLSASLMLHPEKLAEPTAVFVAGNDPEAKDAVRSLLASAGWEQIIDLGDLSAARGLEAWLLLWPRMYGALKTGEFNLRVVGV